MGIVSTDEGDFTFQTVDEALKLVQMAVQDKSDLWISGERPYPCIAVCINGEYAAINFFRNDEGDMWLSYHDKNQKEVTFISGGEEWTPDANAIVALSDVFSCVREFLETHERPTCIQWQEL